MAELTAHAASLRTARLRGHAVTIAQRQARQRHALAEHAAALLFPATPESPEGGDAAAAVLGTQGKSRQRRNAAEPAVTLRSATEPAGSLQVAPDLRAPGTVALGLELR